MAKILYKRARIYKDGRVLDRRCDKCGNLIQPGTVFKMVDSRTTVYSRRRLYRCENCPEWRRWDLSNSLAAHVDKAIHDFWEEVNLPNVFDSMGLAWIDTCLEMLATRARDLATERKESSIRLREGTVGKGKVNSLADDRDVPAHALDAWAEKLSNFSVFTELPSFPEDSEDQCDDCGAVGYYGDDPEDTCDECDGEGVVVTDPPKDELDAWRQQAKEKLEQLVVSPVEPETVP